MCIVRELCSVHCEGALQETWIGLPHLAVGGEREREEWGGEENTDYTCITGHVLCFQSAGRPPWYDSHGQIAEAFVIGKSP